MNFLIKTLATVLLTVLKLSSPALVKELKAYAKEFYFKCLATPNPWDDVLAEAFCQLLGVDTSK